MSTNDKKFIELKTTDNQKLYVRPKSIGAFEVVTPSSRVEGHLKVYVGGFKFLVKEEEADFLAKMNQD